MPAGDLVQGQSEHRTGQRGHEPGILNQAEEGVGVEEPTRGMLPAHQSLNTVDFAGVEVDLGLVVHDELIGDQRRT